MIGMNYKNIETITALLQSALADAIKLERIIKLRDQEVCNRLNLGTMSRATFSTLRVTLQMLDEILSKDEEDDPAFGIK